MRTLVGVADACKQVALQHLRRSERETTVVHSLEDGIGITFRVSGDLDQVHVLHKPVHEIGQG